jgi:hypothetical protein
MLGLSESCRLYCRRCKCRRVFFEQHSLLSICLRGAMPNVILTMRYRSVTFRTAMEGRCPRCSFEMLLDTRRPGGRLPPDAALQSTYPAYRRPR